MVVAERTGVEPVMPATGKRDLSPLVLADDRPLRSFILRMHTNAQFIVQDSVEQKRHVENSS